MSPKQQLIDELEQLIVREIEIYQRILDCQAVEKRALVARSLASFLSNLQAQEQLISRLTRIEQQRREVAVRLAPLLNLSVADLTLKTLSMTIEEPYASRFAQSRERFRQLIRRVQQGSRENARLIQESLVIVEAALTFLTGLAQSHTTYKPSGTTIVPTQGQLLSERV